MSTELKKCPFCGGYNVNIRGGLAIHGTSPFWVQCEDCLANTESSMDEEEAIKAWNTRKPMDEVVEQLERLPNVNSDYWNFSDLVDREDVLEIVKGVQND